VPLIMQDMSFTHERNKFIGLLWASGVSTSCKTQTLILAKQSYSRESWVPSSALIRPVLSLR
jgi:hypothetical protein